MKDYLASLRKEPHDALQYGVKGMKWGQRRSSSQLRAAAAKRAATPDSAASKPPVGPESAATRYARLQNVAKSGGASQLSDEDLRFFNARTEAIAKVQKMNQVNPGWLSTTSKTVLQKAAQRQMQEIADAVANKYISGPIVDNIGKHISKEAASKAAGKAAKKVKS
jgi:hypothetical protein